jgi:hypothetical protein
VADEESRSDTTGNEPAPLPLLAILGWLLVAGAVWLRRELIKRPMARNHEAARRAKSMLQVREQSLEGKSGAELKSRLAIPA